MTSLRGKSSSDLRRVVLSYDEAKAIDKALTKTITQTIAFYGNEPYPDDPRWTPWTRFGKPLCERARAARGALREAMADA